VRPYYKASLRASQSEFSELSSRGKCWNGGDFGIDKTFYVRWLMNYSLFNTFWLITMEEKWSVVIYEYVEISTGTSDLLQFPLGLKCAYFGHFMELTVRYLAQCTTYDWKHTAEQRGHANAPSRIPNCCISDREFRVGYPKNTAANIIGLK